MSGFLFNDIIFGPVNSRRLGVSLGINLLPVSGKLCNYNCIYCECGLTHDISKISSKIPSREKIKRALEFSFINMKQKGEKPDSITFAGNGEPTLHPEFAEIIDDVINFRNMFLPDTKISVLTNATTAANPLIFSALMKADSNIMKLDAGTEEMYQKINRCRTGIKLSDIVENLLRFNGNLIVQTLFIKGDFKGQYIDNTTLSEINPWLGYLQKITPKSVMIYPIARATPLKGLEKVKFDELKKIADKVKAIGLKAEVYE